VFEFLFQCSSASRKFLKWSPYDYNNQAVTVSVLFSEPKIPQSGWWPGTVMPARGVSVLFSEPKIPQTCPAWRWPGTAYRFSALQRAENSSK